MADLQAMVMGFGGTGAHILTYLKELSILKHGTKPEGLEFVLFDTLANWQPGKSVSIMGGAGEEKMAEGHEEATSLDPNSEYFYLKDDFPPLRDYVQRYLTPNSIEIDQYPHFKDWLHAPWLGSHVSPDKLNIKEGAAQQRQIGRFAMFQNVDRISDYIAKTLRKLRSTSAGATVNVWLISSSAGGTGAGSILDAALMTRMVAQKEGMADIQLTGVIVFPDLYDDKGGISKGRAYSLFRELDRFQEVGCGQTLDHRYTVQGGAYASDIKYDAQNQKRALVPSSLFDNLFYLGTSCRSDSDRENFFMSAANAIDPYMDSGQGRQLLEQSINKIGIAASSFGAARIYIPKETYAELFAWEEAQKFIRLIVSPKYSGTYISDVYSGHFDDREIDAKKKVKNLLPLFDELLKLEGKTNRELQGFAKNTLSPKEIIATWYQLAAVNLLSNTSITAKEVESCLLTYVNPYLSLKEPDEIKILTSDELRVKTYKENKSSKGSTKESQIESRDRFAIELENVTQAYTGNGQHSFNEGKRIVFNLLKTSLEDKIDTLITDELNLNNNITYEEDRESAGTPMTRLYHELVILSSNDGALEKIEKIIGEFLTSLEDEKGDYSQRVVEAVNDLRDTQPGWFGPKIENFQQTARSECYDYIIWYQKRELIKDMLQLVRVVRQRFEQWAAEFKQVIDHLVLGNTQQKSAWENIDKNILRLKKRLSRLARNKTALISCEPDLDNGRDTSMQGYRNELREKALGEQDQSASMQVAQQCIWSTALKKGKPQLVLKGKHIQSEALHNIYKGLHLYFLEKVNRELDKVDIFDYLSYAQKEKNVSPEKIAELLNNAAQILLETNASIEAAWVYKEPNDADKSNFSKSLQGALQQVGGTTLLVGDSYNLHSDKNALTLLKNCKPAPDQVNNIKECLNDYIDDQNQSDHGGHLANEELYRAQVYHPFRAELEAWYIERWHMSETGFNIQASDHITPRLIRLLDYPERIQAFIYCIATKVIRRKNKIWEFNDLVSKKTLMLNNPKNAKADVVRAAVIFVLRQIEAKDRSRQVIDVNHALQSAEKVAEQAKMSLEEYVLNFVGTPNDPAQELNDFLEHEEHFRSEGLPPDVPAKEKQHLQKIFQFYASKDRRADLADRLVLP